MNSAAIKHLVILVVGGIAAALFGSMLASADYDNLLLLSYVAIGLYVLAAPGFVPLIAIGILSPFILPIPFIYNFPFIALILAVCCVKIFFRNALARHRSDPYRHCFTWGFVALFAWVALRYCMK